MVVINKRGFDQLPLFATGVHSFAHRYGKRRRLDQNTPPVAPFRCNLTALSQVNNLFFTAHGDSIHVHIPQFPTQAVAERPALVISSQPSAPNLSGYIDPHHPHYINYLIVQFLGTEEVVAVVRDDGDVDAFLIRHVVQALATRATGDSSFGIVAHEIRPFFQSNVGSSAWGLAIHTQARILATSSNAHEITVFKFGLLQSEGDGSPPSATSDDEAGETALQRKTDVTHQVLNGDSNIPYISFCNTGDDPTAKWLLTTDIGGTCRVMNLHSLQFVQSFRFGHGFVSPHTGGYDRFNAGWVIAFLDRRSFQPENSFDAALGLEIGASLPGIKKNSRVWDITNTVDLLDQPSQPFIVHKPKVKASKSSPTSRSRSSLTTSRNSPAHSTATPHGELELVDAVGELSGNESDEDDGGVSLVTTVPDTEEHDPMHESRFNSSLMDDADESDTRSATSMMPDAVAEQDESDGPGSDEPFIVDGDLDPEDEGTEDSTPFTAFYNGSSVGANEPRFGHMAGSLCDDLPCPVFHASLRNAYLIQPSARNGAYNPPMVGLANSLRQDIQHEFEYLRLFERLNMYAEIRPLGVLIVASQKGRALVLSLTKLASTASHPPELRRQADQTAYAMRLECILPFAHQEQANERPFAPLHGIAVSPLQGSDTSRWRLMMMYQDHSILSYEIGRRHPSQGSMLDTEQLIM